MLSGSASLVCVFRTSKAAGAGASRAAIYRRRQSPSPARSQFGLLAATNISTTTQSHPVSNTPAATIRPSKRHPPTSAKTALATRRARLPTRRRGVSSPESSVGGLLLCLHGHAIEIRPTRCGRSIPLVLRAQTGTPEVLLAAPAIAGSPSEWPGGSRQLAGFKDRCVRHFYASELWTHRYRGVCSG